MPCYSTNKLKRRTISDTWKYQLIISKYFFPYRRVPGTSLSNALFNSAKWASISVSIGTSFFRISFKSCTNWQAVSPELHPQRQIFSLKFSLK